MIGKKRKMLDLIRLVVAVALITVVSKLVLLSWLQSCFSMVSTKHDTVRTVEEL